MQASDAVTHPALCDSDWLLALESGCSTLQLKRKMVANGPGGPGPGGKVLFLPWRVQRSGESVPAQGRSAVQRRNHCATS